MFNRKKKDKTVTTVVRTTSTSGGSTVQTYSTSSITQTSHTRVVNYSERSSSSTLASSRILSPNTARPLSSATTSRSIWNPPVNLQRDARAWNSGDQLAVRGYESPFSRHLPPYRSARTTPTTPLISSSSGGTSSSSGSFFPRSIVNERSTSVYQPSPSPVSALNVPATPPRYETKGKKLLLIINNIKFLKKEEERRGAEKDEEKLKQTFRAMNFEITCCRNQKMSEMKRKIQNFRSQRGLKRVDLVMVIIMSHGTNVNENNVIVRGGYTQVLGSDGKGLEVDDILNEFTAEKCPDMKGKPKIFIIQSCRGDQQELHTDANPINLRVREHADMLLAFSTLPGFFSIRDPQLGSWYIQSICEVFQKHAGQFDIETLLKIVDQQLSKKHPNYAQTSTYESRGFNKHCHLVN